MPRINTPERVREARHKLGLSTRALAALLRLGSDGGRTVRRWEAGDTHITGPAQVALECILYGDPQQED